MNSHYTYVEKYLISFTSWLREGCVLHVMASHIHRVYCFLFGPDDEENMCSRDLPLKDRNSMSNIFYVCNVGCRLPYNYPSPPYLCISHRWQGGDRGRGQYEVAGGHPMPTVAALADHSSARTTLRASSSMFLRTPPWLWSSMPGDWRGADQRLPLRHTSLVG